MTLFDDLKAYRLAEARIAEQPAFCVFSNKVLDALVSSCPQTTQELLSVNGIGPQKVAKYGANILEICRAHRSSPPSQNGFMAHGSMFPAHASSSLPLPVASRVQAHAAQETTSLAAAASSSFPVTVPVPSPPPPPPPPPEVGIQDLNVEQRAAASFAVAGRSCFFSGAAGTGKSFLLRFTVKELCRLHGDDSVAITAPTGIAASHIGGVTLHSWAGIGLGKGKPETIIAKVLGSSSACARWRRARVLVIDEVSMLDSELFTVLDAVGRTVRAAAASAASASSSSSSSSSPFGGLQVVACGDFFQLPPVQLGRFGKGFAFQSPSWRQVGMRSFVLTEPVRQAGDPQFSAFLNELRVGVCRPPLLEALLLAHVSRKALPTDGILPTKLYCTNANVDAENSQRLAALPGNALRFQASDSLRSAAASSSSASDRKRVLDLMERKAPAVLDLKVGAQVVLTVNRPGLGLVNGSRGVVVGFQHRTAVGEMHSGKQDPDSFGVPVGYYDLPLVRFDGGGMRGPQVVAVKPSSFFQGGAEAVVRVQSPLKLAWALTVHKSQGMTLSRVEVALADAFEFGQAYVALSRATCMAGLWLSGPALTDKCIKAHPDVLTFYQQSTITNHAGEGSSGGVKRRL